MFRPIFAVFAFVAFTSAQREFINKCSLSVPDLEKCFIEKGNLAVEQLSFGLEDLDIPSLDGYDLGDLFFSLKNDLSFLLEDGKAYPRGLKIQDVKLTFGPNKEFRGLFISFSVTDVNWQAKYRALGVVDNHKVKEKGFTQINFGELTANYTMDFKSKEVAGESYLKGYNQRGFIDYEKFEFVTKDVQAQGEHLKPEHFQQMEEAVVQKLVDISTEHVTFVFNQIFLEIPEKDIFLP